MAKFLFTIERTIAEERLDDFFDHLDQMDKTSDIGSPFSVDELKALQDSALTEKNGPDGFGDIHYKAQVLL